MQIKYFKCILAPSFNRGQNLMCLPNAGKKEGKSLSHLTLSLSVWVESSLQELCRFWNRGFFMSLWWQHGMVIECQKPAMYTAVNLLQEGLLLQSLDKSQKVPITGRRDVYMNTQSLPKFPGARYRNSKCSDENKDLDYKGQWLSRRNNAINMILK